VEAVVVLTAIPLIRPGVKAEMVLSLFPTTRMVVMVFLPPQQAEQSQPAGHLPFTNLQQAELGQWLLPHQESLIKSIKLNKQLKEQHSTNLWLDSDAHSL
jgi:hypothetical protein